MLLYQPLLKTFTKGKAKAKIKEGHTSLGRSLGTTNVAQNDAGLYTKDTLSQNQNERGPWGFKKKKKKQEQEETPNMLKGSSI